MRYRNSIFVVLALVGLSTGTHVNAEDISIIGAWRGQYAESCAAVKEGRTEDFVKISKKQIERYEGDCGIIRQVAKGDRHELQILCETEGETVRDTLKIKVISRDQIDIEGAGRYDRCE